MPSPEKPSTAAAAEDFHEIAHTDFPKDWHELKPVDANPVPGALSS